jgi:uncharacterized membrane protein YkvA (DUF1232 family)
MEDLSLVIAALVVAWAIGVVLLVVVGRRLAADELATAVPAMFRLCRDLLRDPRVGVGPKVWLALATVYLLSPIDLLPEFIPVIGPVDDAVVAALVLRHLVRRSGSDIVREHWSGGPVTLALLLRVAGGAEAAR